MTIRELYRNTLIELNKEEASALYVEDFLYYANKAISWYTNTRYNQMDVSQQLSDDLRVLRTGPEEVLFDPVKIEAARAEKATKCDDVCESTFTTCDDACGSDQACKEVCEANKVRCKQNCIKASKGNLAIMEYNYRHLLNCIVKVKTSTTASVFGCDQKNNTSREYAAKRLTADRKAAILNNAFLDPQFYRPYYDIIGDTLHIKTGDESDDYNIEKVTIEYLRDPKIISLYPSQLLTLEDTTENMEFDDYINVEILNQIVVFIMEQGSDPRVSVTPMVNQSIQAFSGGK